MVDRSTAGTALMVGGVALFALTLLASAALAPTIGAAGTDATRQTLVGSQGGGPGLHDYGSVYLLTGNNTTWKAETADSYFDVTMLDNGSVMAGFMHSGYQDCGPYSAPCTHTGFQIISPNPEPRVVAEYGFPVRDRKNSEVHDVERLPSGEFLLTDMEHERIFTVKGGEVTWQWNASSFYEAPPDPTTRDWLHINDVDVIGEDRYLVSVRNANQLVVVERGEGVVEVINEDTNRADDGDCRGPQGEQLKDQDGDGDIRCGNPDLLDHQHNPQWLGDGAVLVADSENNRVVELHRTEDGDWEEAWTIYKAEDVRFSWPRDADRLENGNTLITDSANQRVLEVNQSGTVVWSYKAPLIPYEAERLPEGETVGGALYNAPSDTGNGGGEIPVLSFLLKALQTSFPIPFWVSELHIFVSFLSVGMVGTGGWLRLRG